MDDDLRDFLGVLLIALAIVLVAGLVIGLFVLMAVPR